MEKTFLFEIVLRPNFRFGWIFVLKRGDRRRVLARSVRDYRTPEKVIEAIEQLQDADLPEVPERDTFELPTTKFELVADVVPLLVGAFDDERDAQFRDAQSLALRPAQAKASPKPKAKAKAKAQAKAQAKSRAQAKRPASRSKAKPRRRSAA
jgi:hypothetical protein